MKNLIALGLTAIVSSSAIAQECKFYPTIEACAGAARLSVEEFITIEGVLDFESCVERSLAEAKNLANKSVYSEEGDTALVELKVQFTDGKKKQKAKLKFK